MPITILNEGTFNNSAGVTSVTLAKAAGQALSSTPALTVLAGLPTASAYATRNIGPADAVAGLPTAIANAAVVTGPRLVFSGISAAQASASTPGVIPQQVYPPAAAAAGAGLSAMGSGGSTGPLTILSPAVLPGVNYSQAYPGITLAATGGNKPYTWSVTSGTMPSGFALSSSGVLTGGTLTSGAGTYNFTVQAKDANNTVATLACSSTVTNEAIQTTSTTSQLGPYYSYYGANNSAVVGEQPCFVAQDIQEEGWTQGGSSANQVLVSQVMSGYDPGNWQVTIVENGPQQANPTTGQVYTGPECGEYFYTTAIGTTEPPLSYFTSLTSSYSQIPPPANGIQWPNEGAQCYEYNYDIWLNGFGTEIMIWTYTVGPRWPWNDYGSWTPSPTGGYPAAGGSPIALTNPVSIPGGTLNPPYGQLVTINCGPGGSPVQYAFSYNYQVSASGQNQSSPVPRGPFNFVQVSGTSAFNNTNSGFVNLIGGGNGLLDWLVSYGYIGGTAGAPGISAYTPTLCGVNYGIEVTSTGGTDYPALAFGVTSWTLNATPTWSG